MVETMRVTAISNLIPVSAGSPASREVTLRVQGDRGEWVLKIPESLIATLRERLNAIEIAASGLQPRKKIPD